MRIECRFKTICSHLVSSVFIFIVSFICSSTVMAGPLGTSSHWAVIHAGSAAKADDADISYYNPAGLVRIPHVAVGASVLNILTRNNFEGEVTVKPVGGPPTSHTTSSVDVYGRGHAIAPGFMSAFRINDRFVAGFNVVPVFAWTGGNDRSSDLKFYNTEGYLFVLNAGPTLGIKITDKFSVGGGLDIQYLEFKGGQVVPIYAEPTSPRFAQESRVSLSSVGVGGNIGALYQFTPHTRVGLAYHSNVRHFATGSSFFGDSYSKATNADMGTPGFAILSGYHDVNRRWALMATVLYMQWSSYKNVVLKNVSGAGDVPLDTNYRDIWDFTIGTTYWVSNKFQLKCGFGYETSPFANKDNTTSHPEGNKYFASLGLRYQATKHLALDLSYSHAFFKNADVNITQRGPAKTTAVGTNKPAWDFIGLQIAYKM